MINKHRVAIASLVITASTLVGIATHEGYMGSAYLDPVGIATLGFGETKNVKLGQKTDPVRALIQLEDSIDEHARGVAACIKVPLYQHEYNAYLSFAYNVGVSKFCKSTMAKKVNAMDYIGGCNELPKWVFAGGKKLPGLVKRREQEYKQCLGI